MEGVGARLGRSSSRYGTTTVFSGPVRKWKKKWVHVTPSSSNNNSNASSNSNHIHHSLSNGTTNGNSGSHLLLYKWTLISQSNNTNNNDNNSDNNEDTSSNEDNDSIQNDSISAAVERPRRKFKYIPIAVIEEEQKKEAEENPDDEAKNADAKTTEPIPKDHGPDEKPDINDVPMEEYQDPEQNQTISAWQDLNVSTLDLSLGLTSHEGDPDSDSRTEQNKDSQSKD
ncbi:hypothetical protein Ancab_004809 [Ancistrocladus abbreviatus]